MEPAYTRLSPQDRTFLDLEKAAHPQHIAACLIFEAKPLALPNGGIDVERIRRYVASRLHLLPRYRQRLAHTPIERHPIWVDDPHFQIARHVIHTALPLPGADRHLKHLVARLVSQPLDRERPLWEMWVVEGLAGGERFALVQKVHHCMIDGISGVDLMAILMRPEADPDFAPGPSFIPARAPDARRLLGDELARRSRDWLGGLRRAPGWLGSPTRAAARLGEALAAVGETLGSGLRPASDTPINRPLGPHRRFDWMELDLARVKAVKDALGGTVNDVVLASVAGALREFLQLRRLDVDRLRVRANVPVSLRQRDERGTLGNRIALLMAELPVDRADPVERLARVREVMAELKRSRQAMGAEVLSRVSEWTSATLLSLAVRVAARGRPYNLVVTNVPGSQQPLYLLGARMLACLPVVNLLPNQGLGVALFSYAGRIFFGFIADWDQLPDLPVFRDAVMTSFVALEEAALRARAEVV